MKQFFFFLFIFVTISYTHAHEYYFAFAEVHYNELTEELQATVIVSTHDLEQTLQKKGIISKDIATYSNNPEIMQRIQQEVQNGFSFFINDRSIPLTFEGMESLLIGVSHFHFSSKNVKTIANLQAKFDLLMDAFPEQQNKITFLFRATKSTFIYLPTQKSQEIKLLEQ
jgi:hypothetical protein